MKIQVTKEHINKGRPGYGNSCPVALAIREQSRYKTALVGTIDWDTDDGRTPDTHPLPKDVQLFIGLFDKKATVSPFEFELEV